jgi:hypothetical protein
MGPGLSQKHGVGKPEKIAPVLIYFFIQFSILIFSILSKWFSLFVTNIKPFFIAEQPINKSVSNRYFATLEP